MNLEDLKANIGKELGLSDWHVVDQDRVTAFADVTEDHQYIHIDADRAADTPFTGTIAHGFLPLSLMSVFFAEAVGQVDGVTMSMNYGFESVRFVSPVLTGKRIRGRFDLTDCAERKPGQWRLTLKCAVEIEGEDRPALVAEWLVLLVVE